VYLSIEVLALWKNMLPAFSGKKSSGSVCVDVNGKFRTPGDFTSMKESLLERMLCDWAEKFTSCWD
jgi:hypothetical protein